MAYNKRPNYLPDWATNPSSGSDVERPSKVIRDDGWNVNEQPPAPWMNWLQFTQYQWLVQCARMPLRNLQNNVLADIGGGDYYGLYAGAYVDAQRANNAGEYVPYYLFGATTNYEETDRSIELIWTLNSDASMGGAFTIPSLGGATGRSVCDLNGVKPTELLAAIEVDNVLQVWKSAGSPGGTGDFGAFSNLTLPSVYGVAASDQVQSRRGARIYRASPTDRVFICSRNEPDKVLRSTSATVTAFTDIVVDSGGVTIAGVWSPTGSPDTLLCMLRDGGGVLRSTNAGSSWTTVLASTATDGRDLQGNADGSLLIATRVGSVCYSVDQGQNWTELSSLFAASTPYKRPASAVACAVDAGIGVIVDSNGFFFGTLDGGDTWEFFGAHVHNTSIAPGADSLMPHLKLFEGQIFKADGGRSYCTSLKP